MSTNFFEVMGIPLIRGRQFTDADRVNSPNVVIINEPFAATVFPDEDPVGQRLLIDLGEPYDAEIVGVVGGVNHFGLGVPWPVEFYVPIMQLSFGRAFVVRTSLDPMTLTDEVQAAVWTIDDQQPVTSLATYEDLVTRSTSQPFFQMMLLGFFAVVALVLGIIALLASYLPARRAAGVDPMTALRSEQ